jgi:hypothetical protein
VHWWWIRLNFGNFTRFHPSWGRSLQIMKVDTGSHRSPSIVDKNPCHLGHGSTWRNPQLLPKTLHTSHRIFFVSAQWKFTQKRTLLVTRFFFLKLLFWKFGNFFQNFSNFFFQFTLQKKCFQNFQKHCHHSVRIQTKKFKWQPANLRIKILLA